MIRKSLIFLYSLIIATSLFSCDDPFDYHPYDAKVKGEMGINDKNISKIENACAGKTTFTFAFMSDSHRSYDEEQALVSKINKIDSVDFVIHGGDLSEYGVTKELIWHRDILGKLNKPYVALLGNHDCLGNGEDVFETIWGKSDLTFKAGNVKFICINTNAFEYDYSHNIPDFDFIEKQINDNTDTSIDKHIVVMHARPYCEQFNNNVAKPFEFYIRRLKNLQFCINGHYHKL